MRRDEDSHWFPSWSQASRLHRDAPYVKSRSSAAIKAWRSFVRFPNQTEASLAATIEDPSAFGLMVPSETTSPRCHWPRIPSFWPLNPMLNEETNFGTDVPTMLKHGEANDLTATARPHGPSSLSKTKASASSQLLDSLPLTPSGPTFLAEVYSFAGSPAWPPCDNAKQGLNCMAV